MTICFISLGGNVGEVGATIGAALQLLHCPPTITVQAQSSLHRTRAVGADAGAEFTNAAAALVTTLAPLELLDRLLAIESEFGRTRTVHWGPRPLDLDLLFFGETLIDERPRLRVPHQACWYRRFVLDPLAEIAPAFVHPEKKCSIRELRERLLMRPLPVQVLDESRDCDALIAACEAEFPQAAISVCHNLGEVSPADSGLLIRLRENKIPAWADSLSRGVKWLDASEIVGDRGQCLRDILRSAGL